ncbi:nitrate reductase, beta subunit [Deferribacter desulfuricans SSM1]|uniref:Nitrate reductase, beta subunit n=1 Tax=Deferribacter desulfuricans (strain DSM 14783 / JCM 11476 / NBRC 101012 / SSM1) TaxID=639282 RepID=D3P9Z6_DEFDS|nr:nitrate reductase subunit beta [Deferribacter desulfuricans]BAI81536.1 nitrate reductase, beta subunit [Deferribacter desulfuricans SSM1]
MDVRAQFSMILNLEKCIGCHTCSVTCKNMWTNRKGAEYMWWNNVETKPGTGYPKRWEDQEKYKGGWIKTDNGLSLKIGGKLKLLSKIFYNPDQPTVRNYYEPWSYEYEHLFNAADGDYQPTARAISEITGDYIEVKSGPNWDDDLSGSDEYALNDPNLSDEEKKLIKELSTVFMFYLPRLCNHCLNPACVASCPSGAIYKRGEDGIVLVNQEKCKSWRYCISACPYKKVYFNWNNVKSEKCIFCYPRIENGEATICSQSCVGKIRSLGVILYDVDKLTAILTENDTNLVDYIRECILDPKDEDVIRAAKESGISEEWITAAKSSPAYSYVKELGIALPLHPEFRTFPSVFYVPPLSPILPTIDTEDYIPEVDKLRIPIKYLSKIFSAGNEKIIKDVIEKLIVVRKYMRAKMLGDKEKLAEILKNSKLEEDLILKAYKLFTQATIHERYNIPQTAKGSNKDSYEQQGTIGFGLRGKKGFRK